MGNKMKKRNLAIGEAILIFGVAGVQNGMKHNSILVIAIGILVVLLGTAMFIALEAQSEYIDNKRAYRSLSIVFFVVANTFYFFATCFDTPIHKHSLLYCEITAVLLFPIMIISTKKTNK